MKSRKNSIAVTLSVRFTIILAVSIILLSILFQILQQQNMRSRQNRDMILTAQRLMEHLTVEENYENLSLESYDIPYFLSYVLYDDMSGEVISTNDPFLPVLEKAEDKSVHKIVKNFFVDGDLNILYCTASKPFVMYKASELSKVALTIQLSMDMTNDTSIRMLRGLPRTVLIMLVPILIISFMALLFITKRTMKPVTEITEAAENISSSNLDTLLPVSKNNNELDYLATTFNSLFQRLKADFDKEHAFTSNVSHELKTPVAVILGQANLLRRWGKDDPAQLEKSLGTIIDEAHSMQSVISNLLMITHMENGTYEFNIENVDVADLFTKVRTEFATVAPKMTFITKIHGEELKSESSLFIKTDRELLRQVLVVIISNSQRYAGEECTITMEATDRVITVSDNGKGFAPEVLPHVFERFYRGDKAHNRKDGGSGLGLSIASTIIQALGGKISASNIQPSGACVTIQF